MQSIDEMEDGGNVWRSRRRYACAHVSLKFRQPVNVSASLMIRFLALDVCLQEIGHNDNVQFGLSASSSKLLYCTEYVQPPKDEIETKHGITQ